MSIGLLIPLFLAPSIALAEGEPDESLEPLKFIEYGPDDEVDTDPDRGHKLDQEVVFEDVDPDGKETGGGGSSTGSGATPYDFVHMDQDALGNSYAVGRDGNGNGVLTRFLPGGTVAWTGTFSSPGAQVLVQDVSVSDAGDIYIVATTYSPSEAAPTATFNRQYRLNSSGFIVSTTTWGLNMSGGLSQCRRIQVREATAQVAVYCDHANTYDGIWLFPLTPGSANMNQIPYNNTGIPVVDMQEGLDGTLWMLHDQNNGASGWDMKLMGFTPGVWLTWLTKTMGTSGSDQRGWGLVSDAHNVLHVAGTTNISGTTRLYHKQLTRTTAGTLVEADREN